MNVVDNLGGRAEGGGFLGNVNTGKKRSRDKKKKKKCMRIVRQKKNFAGKKRQRETE